MQPLEKIKSIIAAKPGAVDRLGMDTFVETPLYKSIRRCRPIYINHDYYKTVFGVDTVPSWEEMAENVSLLFSCTIEEHNGTGEIIGTAYVDRQVDPLDLSLSGNLGSGRAYYIGRNFNVKGEKTPLAQSPRKQFSDGFVEMERAIWETVIANSLQGSISTGLNGVFAILDLDDLCEVVWRDKPVKRAKIIRMDVNGELDRVTHLFHAKKSLTRAQMIETARCYGTLEADKFAERIVHGTWSPGNISLQGHLIDFDTVCATKGRGPVYSSTQWFHENRFGFEYEGQLKVLKAMTDDPIVNKDAVTIEELRDEMMSARKQELGIKFLSLMGFHNTHALYPHYRDEVDKLVELWQELSRKILKHRDAFSLKHQLSSSLHIFDFSTFFRIYPLMKREGSFTPGDALSFTLLPDEIAEDILAQAEEKTLDEIALRYQDAVDAVIAQHFVTDLGDTMMLKLAAFGFVSSYDALFDRILTDTRGSLLATAARAYAINEDRVYMSPMFTVSFHLAENKYGWKDQTLDRIIHILILANTRHYTTEKTYYLTDIKLYNDVFAYKIIGNDGCHDECVEAYTDGKIIDEKKNIDDMEIFSYFYRDYSLLMNDLSISSGHQTHNTRNILNDTEDTK